MTYLFAPPVAPSVAIVGRGERFPVRRIYAMAHNHVDHAQEMGASGREPPSCFLKPGDAESLVVVEAGQVGAIRYPSLTRELFHEIELVIAIGVGGRDIPAADAPRHVFGYAVGLDMTRIDLQRAAASRGHAWCPGKSFDDCAVIGPITPREQAGALAEAEIFLQVHGVERQRSRISRLIWGVATIVEQLSRIWTLRAGDLIYTGTSKGVAAVVPGDRMEGGITGLGTLKVEVMDSKEIVTAKPVRPIVRYVCPALTKPLPIYSHATIHAGVAQISAVQGFVPGTFGFPEGGVAAEAEQMMRNLGEILAGVGGGFDRILKMTLFFSDMARDFPAVNEVVNRFIPEHSPARSSIGVAALPRGCHVVVDCSVAVDGPG